MLSAAENYMLHPKSDLHLYSTIALETCSNITVAVCLYSACPDHTAVAQASCLVTSCCSSRGWPCGKHLDCLLFPTTDTFLLHPIGSMKGFLIIFHTPCCAALPSDAVILTLVHSLQRLSSPAAKLKVQAAYVKAQPLCQARLWQQPFYPIHCSAIPEQQQRWKGLQHIQR